MLATSITYVAGWVIGDFALRRRLGVAAHPGDVRPARADRRRVRRRRWGRLACPERDRRPVRHVHRRLARCRCWSVPWSSAAWLSQVSWSPASRRSRNPWQPSGPGWDADDRSFAGCGADAGAVAPATVPGQGVDSVDDVDDHRSTRPLPAAGPGRSRRTDTDRRHPLLAGQGPRPQPRRRDPRAHPRRARRARLDQPAHSPPVASPPRPSPWSTTPPRASGDPQAPGGAAYVVNEWIDGETLADRLTDGPMPEREVRTVLRRLAEGVAEAHRVGLAVGGLTTRERRPAPQRAGGAARGPRGHRHHRRRHRRAGRAARGLPDRPGPRRARAAAADRPLRPGGPGPPRAVHRAGPGPVQRRRDGRPAGRAPPQRLRIRRHRSPPRPPRRRRRTPTAAGCAGCATGGPRPAPRTPRRAPAANRAARATPVHPCGSTRTPCPRSPRAAAHAGRRPAAAGRPRRRHHRRRHRSRRRPAPTPGATAPPTAGPAPTRSRLDRRLRRRRRSACWGTAVRPPRRLRRPARPTIDEDGARRHRFLVIGLPLLALAVVVALAVVDRATPSSRSPGDVDDVEGSTPSPSPRPPAASASAPAPAGLGHPDRRRRRVRPGRGRRARARRGRAARLRRRPRHRLVDVHATAARRRSATSRTASACSSTSAAPQAVAGVDADQHQPRRDRGDPHRRRAAGTDLDGFDPGRRRHDRGHHAVRLRGAGHRPRTCWSGSPVWCRAATASPPTSPRSTVQAGRLTEASWGARRPGNAAPTIRVVPPVTPRPPDPRPGRDDRRKPRDPAGRARRHP